MESTTKELPKNNNRNQHPSTENSRSRLQSLVYWFIGSQRYRVKENISSSPRVWEYQR